MKKYLLGDKDGIFGKIGVDGIITDNAPENFLTNLEIPILNHTNIFKNEILSGTIMPFLNAHYGAHRNLYIQHSITHQKGAVEWTKPVFDKSYVIRTAENIGNSCRITNILHLYNSELCWFSTSLCPVF